MLVDLHSHYPMHVRTPDRARSLRIWSHEGRASLGDRVDGAVIGAASRLWNYRSLTSGPRVTIESMRAGGVGLALSVLCTPFLEIGNRLTKLYRRSPPYGGPPIEGHLDVLLRQLCTVESRVARHHEGEVLIAHNPGELDKALAAGKLTLVTLRRGRLQPRSDAAVGRASGEGARPSRRCLHHARPSLLAAFCHERAQTSCSHGSLVRIIGTVRVDLDALV